MRIRLHYFVLFCFTLPFWLSSCVSNDQIDIREYYFPVEQMEEGLVYEYRSLGNDSLGPSYWFYKSIETDSALYFTGTYYEADFTPRQFFRSEIVSNGCLMEDYYLYAVDSLGKTQRLAAEVQAPNAFPFIVRDSGGIFLFKLHWVFNESPLQTTTLIRNRRYIGKEQITWQGKPLDCAIFEVKELVDDFKEGHLEKQYPGLEYYAKGIGLIYYKKEISDNFVLEYELADRYPMQQLEQKFRQQMENKE